MSTALILAALPSPSSNAIDVGPLSIRAYGEAIGIGVGARRAQELFGRPSDLRWALRIDPQHRPDGFADVATYHPSFLYGASDRSRHGDRRRARQHLGQLGGAHRIVGVLVIRSRPGHPGVSPGSEGLEAEQPRPRTAAATGLVSCQQVARMLQSYLDQEVDERAAGRVAAHLEMCRRCGLEADVYREIKASLSRSTPAVSELTLRRLRRFGEELSARASGHPQGTGI